MFALFHWILYLYNIFYVSLSVFMSLFCTQQNIFNQKDSQNGKSTSNNNNEKTHWTKALNANKYSVRMHRISNVAQENRR